MRHPLLLAVAPLVLLSACATQPAVNLVQLTDPNAADSGSAYGQFLAGQAAMADGRSDEAGRYFDRAHASGADPQMMRERAFTAALLAGEFRKARELAPTGEDASEGLVRMARLAGAVDDLAQGKGKASYQALAGDDIGFPHRSAAAMLAPWAAAQAGDIENSIARPDVRGDRVVEFFGQLGQAYLLERAKRFDEAETDFKAVSAGDSPSVMTVLAYGGFLERRGRKADAVALYDQALSRDPEARELKTSRARAASGGAAPKLPTIREGAAEALLGPAATMLAAKQSQLGLIYLRLALHLNPKLDEAWLLVGDILAESGDMAGARDAYGKPKPGSVAYSAGQAKLAWTYQSEDDPQAALKLARAAAASGDFDAQITLADLLRANEQYAEAIQVLDPLIAEAKTPDWRLLYARGVAYERIGRWADAERDLQGALAQRPDDPELLNYLGYSWIDRGVRLKEGLAMVEKAVASNPKSGAMVDSLGWAHYRLGDYKTAVEKLEQAVELEAGDPEINNHLGDAYWRVGRRSEAQFQWRRVLTLDPDERIKADAEAKLASGLGPDGPAKAPKVATGD